MRNSAKIDNNLTGQAPGQLQRRLTLPLLILYGLGVTVGAGIYVLVGLTAAEAGLFAPVSFLLAAIIVTFTGLSYAEFSTRLPVSAGEAAYVKAGLNSKKLSLIVGLMVAASGLVSASAISIGAAAYISPFLPISQDWLIVMIILALGFVAIWGVMESVSIAGALTLIEIAGLFFVIYYGFKIKPDLLNEWANLIPPFELSAWAGISSAGLLAFFAFIGFEDLANIAEEVKDPRKSLPTAIIMTILIATAIYLAVVSVVVLTVPLDRLSASASPLALLFENASSGTRASFNLIAAVATINGVLIQMIMSSRVLYGLAAKGQLPNRLAYVSPKTQTPVFATILVISLILVLALFLPIDRLAEMTSQITLTVFAFVNLALIKLKLKRIETKQDIFTVSIWIPVTGLFTSILLLVSGFF